MKARPIAMMAACIVAIAACSQSTPTPPAATDATVAAATDAAARAEHAANQALTASTGASSGSSWSYDTQTDEMRGTTSYLASISSENEVSVGPPYDDDNARLTIRKRPEDGLSVIVRAPGQFLCNSYSGGHVSVKFDGGPIERYSCSEPSDSSTGVIFVNSEQKFVTKLKAAKRVIIEAEFFQAGAHQMIFNVGGLDFPSKTAVAK